MDTNSTRTAANSAANKIIYSAPASPAATVPTATTASNDGSIHHHHATANSSSPVSGVPPNSNMFSGSNSAASVAAAASSSSTLSTPKKHFLDAIMLQTIREKLKTPGGACELHSLHLECSAEPVNVIKDRYLISTQPSQISAAAAAKTPASYRHLIDLTSSNLKCTDVFTEQQFLCKIINEPLHKVQRAYFKLQRDEEGCNSSIYGHPLVRGVHDIVSLSKTRTYVIIEAPPQSPPPQQLPQPTQGLDVDDDDEYMDEGEQEEECYGVYEDLHTYIRNKRRLCETEARALFHQICQTVQVCHRHGIILRDLKLKRFYFIDEARTKLQYESLEGSMILDNTDDDTLSDKIGCPLYTAPELLCPNPTYRGKPADMWSLGVILYTMLVGQYPFYEKGNCNLITIIRHCHVQIPSSLSKSVRWLLLALLRKNYEERMIAEHIFYSPWLKEQRPYYMYIPADVVIADDIDCAGDDDDYFMTTLAMGTMAMSSNSYMDAPLNYTRSALQMESDDDDDEDEVEMG